jgi:putative membrane protein
MLLRITLAALHLVALGLGLYAVISRGTALREAPNASSIARAFRADSVWGIAALLWIGTGLWRLFAETEKPIGYYMVSDAFYAKMGMLALILALEIWPMLTLIRWRVAIGRGAPAESLVERGAARRIAVISHIEALLVVGMVFAAATMARSAGLP